MPPTEEVADEAPEGDRRPKARSEAFLWLSVIGLLLLLGTLPLGVALGGMFECFATDDQCRAALDRHAAATTITAGVVIAFIIVTVAAMIVGRRRLPLTLLAMSVGAVLLGIISLEVRAGLSPWVPAGFWVAIPAASLLAIGAARQVRWYGSQS